MVHNAGIVGRARIDRLDHAVGDRFLAVHLYGAFALTRVVWPHMATHRHGRIVSTTSAAGHLAIRGSTGYSAAMMAIVERTRAIAREGAAFGIRANVILPGAFTRLAAAAQRGPGSWGPVDEPDPAHETCGPADLPSSVVAGLSHPDCRSTGKVFTAAGGRVPQAVIAEPACVVRCNATPEGVRDAWIHAGDRSELIESADVNHWGELAGPSAATTRFFEDDPPILPTDE